MIRHCRTNLFGRASILARDVAQVRIFSTELFSFALAETTAGLRVESTTVALSLCGAEYDEIVELGFDT